MGGKWSPANILQSRNLRTNIPTTKANLRTRQFGTEYYKFLKKKQTKTKQYYDLSTKLRPTFEVNENIVFRNGKVWEKGKIISSDKERRAYVIQKQNGKIIRRNSFHIRKSLNTFQTADSLQDLFDSNVVKNNIDCKAYSEVVEQFNASESGSGSGEQMEETESGKDSKEQTIKQAKASESGSGEQMGERGTDNKEEAESEVQTEYVTKKGRATTKPFTYKDESFNSE